MLDKIILFFKISILKIISLFITNSEERKSFIEKNKDQIITNKTELCSQYKIISLGIHCLTRYALTLEHVKPTKDQGELSCPFDLAFHSSNAIIYFLKNKFNKYFENLQYDFQKGFWVNKDFTIEYNHDLDCNSEEKDKLVARYTARINNFSKLIEDKNTFIYFVITSPQNEKACNTIFKTLKKLRNNINFKLIVLDINKKLKRKKLFPCISIFSIHHPFIYEYNWWKEGYRDSIAGKEYFKLIGDFVKDEISKDFNVVIYEDKKCFQ